MILQIDTGKIPDKDIIFIAELVIMSGKNNCTIDQSIKECEDILKRKQIK
jgi:hypothetical protein